MLKVTKNFFDRQKVIDAVDDATLKNLSRFGAFVMTTARRSLRYRKRISAPGSPPSSHTGLLRDMIFFSYDDASRSVVIGPEKVDGFPYVGPGLLEHGGTIPDHTNRRSRIYKQGQVGPIRIGASRHSRKATGTINIKVTDYKGKSQIVAYAKLLTPAMVERSNNLEVILFGPRIISGANLAARPFMGPALEKELHALDSIWRDSVKSNA